MAKKQSKDQGVEFLKWFGPLLDALRDLGGSASTREAIDAVAKRMNVTEDERQVALKSGVEKFANQVRWARQYLVWEGLLDAGQRGIWSLTSKGVSAHLTLEDAKRIQKAHSQRQRTKDAAETFSAASKTVLPPDTPQADAESELASYLAVLQGLTAKGFEHYCLRVLREAGFERLEVTGRSNDGGVDGEGVLQVNDLVSFSVVFQCKKWQAAVPPKEIRDLRGAMAGRAEKAIFLTTSRFTVNAREEAERPGAAQIELVDGEKLFEIAGKYKLGLKPRTVFDVDIAFFEAFK
ncbi:restriction endonuclease [uncultured Hydrogenophaga sp.]|uniref:restriction endonuclease n=1 Tax=uncultured Hydrogenophaga sp. TaxID=199683 RepID=UPI00258FE4BE|nr:restriction endonuclease [uncultured Hydrogenophaga sp.]